MRPGKTVLSVALHNGGVGRELFGVDRLRFDGDDFRAGDEHVSVLQRLPTVSIDHAHITQQCGPRMSRLRHRANGEEQDDARIRMCMGRLVSVFAMLACAA